MKQTAVQWLINSLDDHLELYPSDWDIIKELQNKAMAMEREQIREAQLEATGLGKDSSHSETSLKAVTEWCDDYYTKTYNTPKEGEE